MNFIRVQIMLEPRQHKALKKAALRSNKSVSQLLRDITNAFLEEMYPEEDEVLQALHTLKHFRERLPPITEQTIEPDPVIGEPGKDQPA